MARYRCEQCKARLVTADELRGQQDQCPACGHVGVVPDRTKRRTAFWIAAGAVAILFVGVGAALIFRTTPPETMESPSPPTASPPPAHVDRSGVRSVESLTVAAVEAVATQYGLRPGRVHEDKEGGTRSWAVPKGLEITCDWIADSRGTRIKILEVWMRSDTRTPADRERVLQLLTDLSPDIAKVAESLSPRFGHRPCAWWNMRWIGGPPYACGVNDDLWRVHVEYLGTQEDIRRCEQLSIVYVNVRIGWFRYLRASQKKLAQQVRTGMTDAEGKKLVSEEMGRIMFAFENVGYGAMFSVEQAAKQQPASLAMQPAWIPDNLPIKMQLELKGTAAAIGSAARIAMCVLPGLLRPFNPYDCMYMAFGAYTGADRAVWGRLANVEGWRQTWGKLPALQEKACSEITIAALAGLMRADKREK